jgi:serine phosphatase RsbU (regulator of sigma subunit)
MKKSAASESRIDEVNSRLWISRYDNPSKVFSEASAHLSKCNKSDYKKGAAYARLNIAACSFLQSKNDIAFENLSESLKWFSENPSEPGYLMALNLKGNLFESFGDYEKALQFCLKAHDLSISIKDRESEAETCSQLGLIYTRLCNFTKALEFYHKGLEIREEMQDENALASSLNRIGMIMRLTKKYEESLEYYFKSLEIRRRKNQHSSIPWTMLGIASTYEEMMKTDEALEYYRLGSVGGDIRCTLQCKIGSGRIYSNSGNEDLAEKQLKESLETAYDLKAMSLVAEAYAALANHYESTKQFEKALSNHKLNQKTKESLQSLEIQNRLKNIEISNAIEKSEQEKEIFRLRHVELKQAYDLIEEKNKDITASINYASRIQRAMLPDPGEIKGLNKNSFILYLPKDIVSGDFYWFCRSDKKLIVIAADCTGHGVPGALMSMLGISFLEEIVNNRKITESGQILNELRQEVQRALRQKGSLDEAKDGMDISLCVIDRSKNILWFSGAFNSLYLVRKNELVEFRADRMPIGISGFSEKSFTTQEIPIFSNDIIYMFSDGYADQFGGSQSKKYKYSTLKTFLLSIHKLPLAKQKQKLEEEFLEWKGTSPQIDDVLILGLKI